MEYVYTALLLNSVGQEINEENVKKVLAASGAKVDDAKVKALISSLEGVNIDEVIKQTAVPIAAAPVKEEKVEEKKEEKPKEEEEKKAEEAVSGLNLMFSA